MYRALSTLSRHIHVVLPCLGGGMAHQTQQRQRGDGVAVATIIRCVHASPPRKQSLASPCPIPGIVPAYRMHLPISLPAWLAWAPRLVRASIYRQRLRNCLIEAHLLNATSVMSCEHHCVLPRPRMLFRFSSFLRLTTRIPRGARVPHGATSSKAN